MMLKPSLQDLRDAAADADTAHRETMAARKVALRNLVNARAGLDTAYEFLIDYANPEWSGYTARCRFSTAFTAYTLAIARRADAMAVEVEAFDEAMRASLAVDQRIIEDEKFAKSALDRSPDPLGIRVWPATSHTTK